MITKDTPLDEAWRIAIAREKSAYEFYRQAAEAVQDSSLRTLFQFLMNQELHHRTMLEDEFSKNFTQEM